MRSEKLSFGNPGRNGIYWNDGEVSLYGRDMGFNLWCDLGLYFILFFKGGLTE